MRLTGIRVYQVDPYLVRARRHPGQVDRVDVARVRPPPRHIIHLYVQMSDSWRCIESALPEHRDDVHVLNPPLDPDDAPVEQVGKRGINKQPGSRLVIDLRVRRGTSNLPRGRSGRTGACGCLSPYGDESSCHRNRNGND